MKSKFFFSVLSVVVAGTCLTACSSKPTIDFEQCVSVDFNGYENEGNAIVRMDNDYILSLLGDMNTLSAASLVNSFSVGQVENNGELSNGDVITVTVDTNQTALDNAKVNVKNTELHFTVEGLEEKPKLDIFSDVSLNVNGSSPYCTVSVEYSGNQWLSSYSFEITSSDGTEKETYCNGDKVTVTLSQDAQDRLKSKGEIEETSHEYTVQADSSYILSAGDLSPDSTEVLKSRIDEYLNGKVADILSGSDNTATCYVISGVSGINAGTLAASSCSVTAIDNLSFNSAYAGIKREKGAFGNIIETKCAYFFYNAEIAYKANFAFEKIDETAKGILVVCITDPITNSTGEIQYKDISLGSGADYQTAYDKRINDSFSKLF